MRDIILYLAVVLLPTFFLYLCRNRAMKSTGFRAAMAFAYLFPAAVYGLRYNVGVDWFNYYAYYQNILEYIHYHVAMEPGFTALVLLCNFLKIDFWGFTFLCAMFMEWCFIKAFVNFGLQREIWFGYFLFIITCYIPALNIMRQMIASMLILLAYSYEYAGKKKLIWLCLISSILIHTSAVFVALYPLIRYISNLKIKRKKIFAVIFTVVATMLGFLSFRVALSVIHALGAYGWYEPKPFAWENLSFLLYFLPECALLFLYFRRGFSDSSFMSFDAGKRRKFLYQMLLLFLLSITFQFIGISLPIADRISRYTMSFRLLLYPMFLHNIKKKNSKRNYSTLCVIWFVIHFTVLYIVMNGHGIFPYRFKWEM